MMGQLMPTRWYYPSLASDPVPCRWEGWMDLGASGGVQWVVVDLFAGR